MERTSTTPSLIVIILYVFILALGLDAVTGYPRGDPGSDTSSVQNNNVQYAYARTKKPNKPTKEERKYAKRRGKLAERWEIDIDVSKFDRYVSRAL